MLTNIILTLVVLCIAASAVVYIIKSKKRGACIGCPYAKNCNGKCNGNCNQNNEDLKK